MSRVPARSNRARSPVFGCAVALIGLGLVGCHVQLEEVPDIAGTYVLPLQGGGDTLTLSTNGEYSRKYCLSSDCKSATGTWEVEYSSGTPRVVLSSFLGRWGSHGSGTVGYWSTYAQRNWRGETWLNVNEDLGLKYVRE